MARVLVTGATGFIGNHLIKLLAQSGHDVTCLVRNTSIVDRLKAYEPKFCYGDVRQSNAVNQAVVNQDLVFHLAGLTKSLRAKDMYEVNVCGTENIVRGCLKVETPPTLIVVSSIAAAGPSNDGRPKVETDPCRPVSHYGKSKLQAEQSVIKACADRVPLSIVRPPIVFGEGDRDAFVLFWGIAKWGLHLVPTFKDPSFSLIHAEDVADALYRVAQIGRRVESTDSATGTYFVADDEFPTYADIGRLIGGAVGRKQVRVVHNLEITVKVSAAINQLIGRLRRRPQIFNLDKASEALAGSWTCSSEKILEDTGFRPLRNLEDRLRQTAEWYAEEGWLRIKDQTCLRKAWNEESRALEN